MTLPVVAIVGRPNVGKSTLFNRLLGRRLAVVFDEPGTTRDRVIARLDWEGNPFFLVDTGGIEFNPSSDVGRQVQRQVSQALEDADVILFLVDVRQGLAPEDEDVASRLRPLGKPVIVVVNKVDSHRKDPEAAEFYRLGLGEPILISAYHNRGIEELWLCMGQFVPTREEQDGEPGRIGLAIVGRANVGKSMLLNAILGKERAIVSDLPGTTRDTVDTPFDYNGQHLVVIDTAGIRRRGRVEVGVEKLSVLRALQAIERADIVLLVVDAQEAGAAQDQHLAGYVLGEFKGVVLVVNKWDLAEARGLDQASFLQRLRKRMKFLRYVPVRFTCALKTEGITEVMEAVLEVYRERTKEIPPEDLRYALTDAMVQHPPPTAKGKFIHIGGVRQEAVNPPTFAFQVNHPDLIHFSYRRYLENHLRSAFGYRGSHLKLVFRKKGSR